MYWRIEPREWWITLNYEYWLAYTLSPLPQRSPFPCSKTARSARVEIKKLFKWLPLGTDYFYSFEISEANQHLHRITSTGPLNLDTVTRESKLPTVSHKARLNITKEKSPALKRITSNPQTVNDARQILIDSFSWLTDIHKTLTDIPWSLIGVYWVSSDIIRSHGAHLTMRLILLQVKNVSMQRMSDTYHKESIIWLIFSFSSFQVS